MKSSHVIALIDFLPRALAVLMLVAALCHVDNLLTAVQPYLQDDVVDPYERELEEEVQPQHDRLSRFISARYKVPPDIARETVEAAREASAEVDLPISLILAVIAVESSFDRYSDNGCCKGLMQVNPPAHPEKVKEIGGVSGLFDIRLGVRTGTRILKEYLNQKNQNLEKALLRYNGATTPNEYPDKVLAEKKLYDKVRAEPPLVRKKKRCSTGQPGCYTPQVQFNNRGQI